MSSKIQSFIYVNIFIKNSTEILFYTLHYFTSLHLYFIIVAQNYKTNPGGKYATFDLIQKKEK